ncbi:MAG: hypothetical protein MUE40_05435 [Anaerolineae bacterium]|jgi:hypothetical protein|nr:hypothetical protein [Anaerolineae bacterium]
MDDEMEDGGGCSGVLAGILAFGGVLMVVIVIVVVTAMVMLSLALAG